MFAPWKDSYDKLIILKDRDITLPTKVHIVKAMIFPVVRYRCEMWFIKEGEHQRINGFEWWSWRRLLRVPWIARRSNQSILKEISPEQLWMLYWLLGDGAWTTPQVLKPFKGIHKVFTFLAVHLCEARLSSCVCIKI